MKLRYFGFLFILLIVAAIVYRMFFSAPPQMGMQMPEGAAIPASVAPAIEKEVEIWNEFSGRLEAVDKVEVKARVGGTLQKSLFKEGVLVNKGDSLFVIDQRPFVAALKNAEAELASARTQLQFAESELVRAENLLKESYIPVSKYDERKSTKESAFATVQQAQAALDIARLNLEYSDIKAPISGRISRAEVTEGNLVDPNMGQVLATIVSTDPIYAEFNVDEQTYLKFVGVSDSNADVSKVPVQINLAGDSATVNGFLRSFDNKLDTKSGTIRARALFENKDGKLIPGLFASVRLGSNEKKKAVLITDRAIGTDQDKKYVLVVNAENKVEYRPVITGASVEGLRVIESGLAAGEKIIVLGLFKYKPGMAVLPQEYPMEGTQAMAQEVGETGAVDPDSIKIDENKK